MVKYRYDGTDVLDDQSLAKHRLIREYLRQYYLTYFTNQKIPKLRLAIVDGFSGGGVFSNGVGTPLLSIQVLRSTELEISETRSRPIEIDPKFYFVDKDPNAIKALSGNLEDHAFHNENQVIYNSSFSDALPSIITDIETAFRSQRSIFILDPYGYKDISLSNIQLISQLKNSEVIWLVTTDHIAHYLSEKTDNVEKVLMQEVGLSRDQALSLKSSLLTAKETGGWPLCRHLICQFLVDNSGFRYGSDFPIRMVGGNKDYTILHLSHHQKAREVMVSGHWLLGNDTQTFFHDGLQYVQPAHIYKNNDLLFSFTESDHGSMLDHASNFIGQLITTQEVVEVDQLKYIFADKYSAMRNIDIEAAMKNLLGDFDFYNGDNKTTKSIKTTTVIKKKRQLNLFPKRSFNL